MKKATEQSSSRQDGAECHLIQNVGIACVQPVRIVKLQLPEESDQEFWSKYPSSYHPMPLKRRVIRKVIQILVTALAFVIGVTGVVLLAHFTGCHQISAVGGLCVGVIMLMVYLSFE